MTDTPITLENILDKIADAIIVSEHTNISPSLVRKNQKTIRNGIITTGRDNSEKMILFQKDEKANVEDLSQVNQDNQSLIFIVNQFIDNELFLEDVTVNIIPSGTTFEIFLENQSQGLNFRITNILSRVSDDGSSLESINVSQFINIEPSKTNVDKSQASEFLDTNIYELLPGVSLRQERINNFFVELNALLPPTLPDFDKQLPVGVDRNPETGEWVGSEDYYLNNSISSTQNPSDANNAIIQEEDAYITRLEENSNYPNSPNTNKSIERIRNRLNDYLTDIDEPPIELQDERPVYQNISNGYLKFRNLNQGIIIRNTNQEYVEGLNPNTREYLTEGFTITMWVRFLDKTSQGTLFNFGNPTRENNPFGFSLETYVINGDESPTNPLSNEFITGFGASTGMSWKDIFQDGNPNNLTWSTSDGRTAPNEGFFSESNTERFVRLVVNENGRVRGSHMGLPFMAKRGGLPHFPTTIEAPRGGYDYYTVMEEGIYTEPISQYDHMYGLMTNVRVPVDLTEWYFICASYNPNVTEPDPMLSEGGDNFYQENKYNRDFWMNHVDPFIDNATTTFSNLGNRCKVEIISKTDLLRARGFKVD